MDSYCCVIPKVRMVRSVAGTKGEERGGSYVILDPRTKFYVPGRPAVWNGGQFTPAITASRNVSFGMMSRDRPEKGKTPFAKEMKTEFTHEDGSATILVSLQAFERLKTTAELRVYDVDNHLTSKVGPVKFPSGEVKPWHGEPSFALASDSLE
jgi:hypothetical protein